MIKPAFADEDGIAWPIGVPGGTRSGGAGRIGMRERDRSALRAAKNRRQSQLHSLRHVRT